MLLWSVLTLIEQATGLHDGKEGKECGPLCQRLHTLQETSFPDSVILREQFLVKRRMRVAVSDLMLLKEARRDIIIPHLRKRLSPDKFQEVVKRYELVLLLTKTEVKTPGGDVEGATRSKCRTADIVIRKPTTEVLGHSATAVPVGLVKICHEVTSKKKHDLSPIRDAELFISLDFRKAARVGIVVVPLREMVPT